MNKKIGSAILALLVVSIGGQFLNRLKLNDLETMLQESGRRISGLEHRLENQVSYIENVLERGASLITNAYTEIGSPEAANMTVPVTFVVELKTIAPNTSVSLDFDGELLPLTQSGIKFSAVKNFAINEEATPTIIIETDGVKQTQQDYGLNVDNLVDQAFPTLHAFFSGESSYDRNGNYTASGSVDVDFKSANSLSNLVSMNYVQKIDGEVFKETPFPLEENKYNYSLEVSDSFKLTEDSILITYVVATDKAGFVYEHQLKHFVANMSVQREPHFDQSTITDPNGNVIFSTED